MTQQPSNSVNPFIGLRPYAAEDSDLFFGRTRQVDDLLSLMQGQRLITVVGPAWSGKTSLIQAGLLPALHRGHHGAAGKHWIVCQTRPGINPLRNLSFALAESGKLHPGLAPAPEEAERFELILRHDNTGLLELYRKSAIAGQSNLLVVIDQMEDLFRYQDHYEEQQRDDIRLFFDNILKATTDKESAVYVLLSLRSEYVGHLFPYRRMQEVMSEGQLVMPRMRRQEIREMITGPAAAVGSPFSEDIIAWMQKETGSEPSMLANLQFLLFHAVEHHGKPEAVKTSDLEQIGGISDIFAHTLQEIRNQADPVKQRLAEHAFRAVTMAGSSGEISQPATVGRLKQLLGCESEALSAMLDDLHQPGYQFLDRVPPVIQGVQRPPGALWDDHDVVNIGNEEVFLKWSGFEKWIVDERESRDHYLFLVESSVRYEAGTAGLLKPPELNIAQKWYADEQPSKAWAQRYHPDFDKAINFLHLSEKAYEDEVLARENEQKRKIKLIRQRMLAIAGAALLIIAVMSVLFTRAQQARVEAQKQKENADVAQQIALKQAEAARQSQKLAESEADRANQAVDRAEEEYQKAEAAREKAEQAQRQTQQALVLEEQAKEQAEKAKEQAEQANSQRAQALELEKIAKQKADDRESLMRILRDFYVLENQLNSQGLNQQLVDQIAATYESYKTYSTKVNGQVLPNNQLQHLLELVEKILQSQGKDLDAGENLFSKTVGGLRAMDVSPSGNILTGGDEAMVFLIDTSMTTTRIKIGERVRSVLFLTDYQLFVGTFLGGLTSVSMPDAKTQILLSSGDTPDPVFYLSQINGGKEVLAVSPKTVYILSPGGQIKSKISAPQPLSAAVWSDSSQLGYLGSSSAIYQFDGKDLKRVQSMDTVLSGKHISALAMDAKYLACGLRSGPILLHKRDEIEKKQTASSSQVNPVFSFIEHKSEVTSLQFDISRLLLYSASLDQTVKIYDLGLPKDKVESTIVTLQGHKKWVWTLDQIIDKDGDHLLMTADEGGNVYKWLYGVEKQLAEIRKAMNKAAN